MHLNLTAGLHLVPFKYLKHQHKCNSVLLRLYWYILIFSYILSGFQTRTTLFNNYWHFGLSIHLWSFFLAKITCVFFICTLPTVYIYQTSFIICVFNLCVISEALTFFWLSWHSVKVSHFFKFFVFFFFVPQYIEYVIVCEIGESMLLYCILLICEHYWKETMKPCLTEDVFSLFIVFLFYFKSVLGPVNTFRCHICVNMIFN